MIAGKSCFKDCYSVKNCKRNLYVIWKVKSWIKGECVSVKMVLWIAYSNQSCNQKVVIDYKRQKDSLKLKIFVYFWPDIIFFIYLVLFLGIFGHCLLVCSLFFMKYMSSPPPRPFLQYGLTQGSGPYYKIVMKSCSILKAPFFWIIQQSWIIQKKITHPP